jgi:hypothetical protein
MLQPQSRAITGQARRAKRVVTRGDDLQSADLLPQIIIRLHDAAHQIPGLLIPNRRLAPHASPLDGPGLAEARLFDLILACVLLHGVLLADGRRLRRIL